MAGGIKLYAFKNESTGLVLEPTDSTIIGWLYPRTHYWINQSDCGRLGFSNFHWSIWTSNFDHTDNLKNLHNQILRRHMNQWAFLHHQYPNEYTFLFYGDLWTWSHMWYHCLKINLDICFTTNHFTYNGSTSHIARCSHQQCGKHKTASSKILCHSLWVP